MQHLNNSNRLRLAIAGCGRVTETSHLPVLQGLNGQIEVIAVADPEEHHRRRVAGMFDIKQSFADLESMLRDAGPIDAVAICTPVQLHVHGVIAALEAGKHVLVEKPLAMNLDDADRMIAAAAAHPGQKVQLGFNLRQHRLVQQAKKMIADGTLGEIHLIRTVWTSGIRLRMKLPPWRNRRETGGGALCEIAVHHLDIVRYLTGAQIEQVFAQTRNQVSDDQTAAVTLRLSNGTSVSSVFSDLSGDANEIEIIGSKGRLSFSIFRFDRLNFVPNGGYGSFKHDLIGALKQFRKAWPILRRGGDFRETYRQEWIAFLDAIRRDQPTAATLQDGYEALRAVLAAGLSANTGKPVPTAESPRHPQPVPRPASDIPAPEENRSENSAGPQLSAILATHDTFNSIRRTVHHLRAQTAQNKIELVIVCPSATNLRLDENEMKGFHSHRVIEIGRFDSVAPANAAGVRAAAAPIVVLCEDHAFPEPNWAQSLIIAHRGPYAAVGPAMHNANPGTLISRADFLIGYGAWAEPIKPCEPHHLPGHNSAYKRSILLEYGDRLADMMEAESVLQWDIGRKGRRLYLDPTARLAHTNFAHLKIWNKVQFHAGRIFGGTRAMDWPMHKRLLYAAASPLIPLVRLKRIWRDARRLGSSHRSLGVLVTLMWGLILDGIGQMVGYLAGVGRSKGIAHEFCRVAHITEEDRQQLAANEPQAQHASQ